MRQNSAKIRPARAPPASPFGRLEHGAPVELPPPGMAMFFNKPGKSASRGRADHSSAGGAGVTTGRRSVQHPRRARRQAGGANYRTAGSARARRRRQREHRRTGAVNAVPHRATSTARSGKRPIPPTLPSVKGCRPGKVRKATRRLVSRRIPPTPPTRCGSPPLPNGSPGVRARTPITAGAACSPCTRSTRPARAGCSGTRPPADPDAQRCRTALAPLVRSRYGCARGCQPVQYGHLHLGTWTRAAHPVTVRTGGRATDTLAAANRPAPLRIDGLRDASLSGLILRRASMYNLM
jgi:hypothetical protein